MPSPTTVVVCHVEGEAWRYPEGGFGPYRGEAHLYPGTYRPETRTVMGRPHVDGSDRPFKVTRAVFTSWGQADAIGLPASVALVSVNGRNK